MSKICSVCHVKKELNQFGINRISESGKTYYKKKCLICIRLDHKKFYKKRGKINCKSCGEQYVKQYRFQHFRSRKHIEGSEVIKCECGGSYKAYLKNNHLKSKTHKRNLRKCYLCNVKYKKLYKYEGKYSCNTCENNINKDRWKLMNKNKYILLRSKLKKHFKNYDNCFHCNNFLNKEEMKKVKDIYFCAGIRAYRVD